MRHGVDGRQFGRNTSHRSAMLKNLSNSLIKEEQVITTIEKAKEARRLTERLITLAKKNTLNARRIAFSRTRDDEVVAKLFGEFAERYKARKGGYTRIVKISERRWGDAAKMAMLEMVDHPKLDKKKKAKESKGNVDPTSPEVAADPFSKFRKLFAGSKKASAAPKAEKAEKKAAPAKEKAEKAAAPKKAPAKKAAKKDEK